ncbi:MAG: type II toxin-antitoxin system HicA family toxin [Planctomycetia bacterium]|nr:type II toxin-antitoxin system HicA family toxin [Planctomycetia bacterium]
MKNFKPIEIIRQLKRDGWYPAGGTGGGHIHFLHPTKKGKVIVPISKKEICGNLLKSIEKQAQLTFE